MKNIQRELKIIAAALLCGLFITILAGAASYGYARMAQQNIAENVIRFHVRAHSDDATCQATKYMVRDRVLATFEPILNAGNNRESTRQAMTQNLPHIETYVNQLLPPGTSAKVNLTTLHFPTQSYGAITFPPGPYESLEIVIGQGQGRNWWCLMFPPLCYTDMTATTDSQQQLATTLSTDSMRLLMHQEENNSPAQVRFRVIEWWHNRTA